MDRTIIVIVGHTGAGKTTVSAELGKRYSLPVISFANCGKQFAKNNNYEHIQDCWNSMQKQEFRKGIAAMILGSVDKELSKSGGLIIDGIYDNMTLMEIRKHYSGVKAVYLMVPKKIRFDRIAKRCGYTIAEVIKENNRKEQIKSYLGIEKVLGNADYFIDATESVGSVVQNICDKTSMGIIKSPEIACKSPRQHLSCSCLHKIFGSLQIFTRRRGVDRSSRSGVLGSYD